MQDRGRAAIMPRLTAAPRIGLRQLLIGLSLAGIVPLAIVATVLLVALWRTQQAQLHESTRATAHVLAMSVEQRLDSTVRRLRSLASLGAPSPQTVEILAANPDWSSLRLLPAGGERAHDKKILDGETAVSDLFVEPTRNTHVVEVGVPVLKDGRAAYGLFATLDARDLSELLRSQLRDAGAIAGIVDADHRIVARTRDAANFIGKPLVAPLDAAVRAVPTGAGRFPLYDGPDVYSAWTRVGGTGWTLILGTPAAPAEAALRRSLGALAALLVIVLVASSLFAWLIARRLSEAMSAERLARLSAGRAERPRAEAERDRLLGEESRARQQAEAASRAKDEFLGMLGHELRNPLGAIGSAVRVIERLPSGSADHKAARDIIGRQTAHLAKIVDDLLDVGRVVSGRILLRRNLVDLAQATAAAGATVRAAQQPERHQWDLDLDTVLVSADPTRVDQILANLLENAVKFTPAGGRISVRLKAQASEAVLTIEDTGPGIRTELLPHVFDLFAKDATGPERGGLGIGLALVRRLVELHGGSVTAENTASGARFTVRLPAIPEPEPMARRDARPPPSPRPVRQARVLIVEDNDDARVTLQRVLQQDGHLVSAARDARAGLEAAMAGSPNIAVVDIGLPGMDGYEFARAMRERLGSGVRLIALTGYGTENDRERAAEAGFDAHLTKPVDLDRLLALIAEAGT
jgi:signal transduction histidine kinase